MNGTIVIDNKTGIVRGRIEKNALLLSIAAQTLKKETLQLDIAIADPMRLLVLSAVLAEMEAHSLRLSRGRESWEFKFYPPGGGLRIASRYSKTHRLMIYFTAYKGESSVRLVMDVGEIRALRTMAEEALFAQESLSVTLWDDINLAVFLRGLPSGLEWLVRTPSGQKTLRLENANPIATIQLLAERALRGKGFGNTRFGDEKQGIAFTESVEAKTPAIKFLIGEETEVRNLSRFNLYTLALVAEFCLRKSFAPRKADAESSVTVEIDD